MKKLVSVILVMGVSLSIMAQKNSKSSMPIAVSYWGATIFHPGLKIGTQHNFKKWNKTKERKKRGTVIKYKTFFLKPEFGFYNHKKNHTGVLLNTDFGIEFTKSKKKFFFSYALGLGYLRHFNSGITYYLEDDNSISEKKLASRGYFMPTLNVGYGQNYEQFSWFNKISLGSKLKYNTGFSIESFIEVGIKFYPFNKNK